MLFHQIRKPQQDAFPLGRKPPGPASGDKGAPARHHRTIDIINAGIGGGGNDLSGRRVVDVQTLFAIGCRLTPFDPQAVLAI